MDYSKITIIGAGHGGYAAAGDLKLKGFDVTIYELPEYQSNLFPLIESGKIKMTGEISGIAHAPDIETNLQKAVTAADIILVISHSASHERIAEMISPYIRDNQIIVLIPGYTGGSLCFNKIFKEQGVKARYILAETNTLPYACRKMNGESAVHIKLYVKQIWASAFPSAQNSVFVDAFSKLYPKVKPAENVLEVGFHNGNPVLNVLPCLFNAGTIERAKGEYYHFQEGVTSRIAGVLEKLDEERIRVGKSLGLNVIPYLERVMNTGYVTSNSNWHEMISTSPHLTAKGPEELDHRYLTEDVPYGLVPWFELAKKTGVDVRLTESSITMASYLLGQDFLESGRTLKSMGIHDMTIGQLNTYLKEGDGLFIHLDK
ncbi:MULTISPECIES: NAD/NADP octopine/nopaline dehydrogenase family protein [Cytobacillus]|uniref:NAD/NADP octopine/nopaline dehydrogenase family protein n=1 Tax=Cytobacillus TaxID=2675230 RepID=UPI00203C996D|nr:NAD/NADP octopine/nopaline dehydrogenase family protein [Cytobacillus firmus]MCM3706371.1 NAD/NADP octopine/nopaline dehydrogenase family protein [Cytobacillus firmus]